MKLVYCSANIYLLLYISHFLLIISCRHLKHTADKSTCAWEFKKSFIFCFITLRCIQAKINEQFMRNSFTFALNDGINFQMSSWPIILIFLSLSYDQFCCNFYIFLNFFVIFIIFYIHLYIDYRLFFILDIIIIIVDLMHVRTLNEYLCS